LLIFDCVVLKIGLSSLDKAINIKKIFIIHPNRRIYVLRSEIGLRKISIYSLNLIQNTKVYPDNRVIFKTDSFQVG
jgi:hypothetical protein